MTDTTAQQNSDPMPSESEEQPRYTVLEVFGLRLEVANPHLAELLTMDARSALLTDIGELAAMPFRGQSESAVADRDLRELRDLADETRQVSDTPLQPPTPKDLADSRDRRTLLMRIAAAGADLGFRVRPDGAWDSPSGLTVVPRAIDDGVSYAAASHFVAELETARDRTLGPDGCGLFVGDAQSSVDVLKVAIRQGEKQHVMRTVSMANLDVLVGLYTSGRLDHADVVALIAPIAAIDAGDIISVLAV